jgi:putative ABC transport system substrate-binding protein
MVDPTLADQRRQIAALSIKYRLPVMLFFREDVEAGALIAYGASNVVQYRQAAGLVHKILRGTRPAELPVEQPNTYDLIVNLGTARALGIEIPPAVLARATVVIE